MTKEVTEKQGEILAFIARRFAETGTGVGFAAICAEFGMQKNAVTGHINALTLKGMLAEDVLPSGRKKSNSLRPKNADVPNNGNSVSSHNFVVSLVPENRVAFMIFSGLEIIESNIYSLEEAVKWADGRKIDANLAVMDRLVKLAEWKVSKKIEVPAKVTVE
jgi:hypothetical protein